MGGRSASHQRGEPALAALATSQHGVVAARQLLQLGFTRRAITIRIESGRLHPVHRGVYAVGHTNMSRKSWWIAAVLAAGPEAVLSHRDAAALWELAELTQPKVEVTLPRLGGRARPGIRIRRTRRLEDRERALKDGIPVTTVARTLLDLAAIVSRRHLREAYDNAERHDLLDVGELRELVETTTGRRGLSAIRRLLARDLESAARSRSALEVEFAIFCRESGLPEPIMNAYVGGYEVDAYWPDSRLVVELDGYEYHRGREAFERDRAKVGDLAELGIEVLPLTHRRLRSAPSRVATTLRAAVAKQRRSG